MKNSIDIDTPNMSKTIANELEKDCFNTKTTN